MSVFLSFLSCVNKYPSSIIHSYYCVILLWNSATAHSLSSKELNLFLLGRCSIFRELYLGILISLLPASSLNESQNQLTHPRVKILTPLRKMFFRAFFLIMFSYYSALAFFDMVFIQITHQ